MRQAKTCEDCYLLHKGECWKTHLPVVDFEPVGFECPLNVESAKVKEQPAEPVKPEKQETKTLRAEKKKKYESRSWLYEQYIVKNLTYQEIANKLEVGYNTIYMAMKKFEIPKKGYSERQRPGKSHSYKKKIRR